MSGTDALSGSWGLADDLLEELEAAEVDNKYLLAEVGGETIAVPDRDILEVVDRPRVTPWLRDARIAGVFALRGDIYTLTDPLLEGEARRIAVVLLADERYVAVACDRMLGVETIDDDAWEELERSRLGWARKLWKRGRRMALLLEPGSYLETLGLPEGKDTES